MELASDRVPQNSKTIIGEESQHPSVVNPASLNQWLYRTPLKPRLYEATGSGPANTTTTPATSDTPSQPQVAVSSPMTMRSQATFDSSSPIAHVSGGPAQTSNRLYSQRREPDFSSPLYNSCKRADYNRSSDLYESSDGRFAQFDYATPKAVASACRFKFNTRPIDLFTSSPAGSGQSCWVNVSPAHRSVLLYTTGVINSDGSASGGVVLGPEEGQQVSFKMDTETGNSQEQTHESTKEELLSSPVCKTFTGQVSSGSIDTPIPTRAGEIPTSSSDRAALAAAIAALRAQSADHWTDQGVSRVVIATDCKYVVTGACDWLVEWARNGWQKAVSSLMHSGSLPAEGSSPLADSPCVRGVQTPQHTNPHMVKIPDADLWQELSELITKLTPSVQVEFLHIPVEWNSAAVKAARSSSAS